MKEESIPKMREPLKVLQETIVEHLEDGIKGSKVPHFHNYIEGSGDLEPEKIPPLKEEILQIQKAVIEGMPFTKDKVEVMVPVHPSGYAPLSGVPTTKDATETITSWLNEAIEHCKLSILIGCGFGNYSVGPEIKKAREQLREEVETSYLPSPKGSLELKIIAYDSNNNPKHGFLIDGMWYPYKAVGLVYCEAENIILAFQATMDYGTGNWELDKFSTEFLYRLAEKSSSFQEAFQKITNNEFNKEELAKIDPEFVKFLKNSPHFRQLLNRVCSRWTH